MNRGALFRARFGEEYRSLVKIEGRESHPPRNLRAALLPVKAAGDHQMQHAEQLVLQAERDPLADSPYAYHSLAGQFSNGWIDRAHHERTGEPYLLQPLPANQGAQPLDVHGDVWKLGHRPSMVPRRVWLEPRRS